MWAIYKKEVQQFLNSLVAYVVIGVFLSGIGLLMWVFPETSVLDYGYAQLDTLFSLGPFVYMFLIPAITMRMLAEERKSGTLELLLTRPLSDFQIILGKYMAAFTLVIFSVLPTLVYYYSVYQLGNPAGNLDTPGIIGSYIGLILLGGVFTSIGLFASALSENQIVAFILAVFFCFFTFTGISALADIFTGQTALYIDEMSLSFHYDAMSRGLIDSRNLVYFLSTITIVLLLTSLKFAARRMSFKPHRIKAIRVFGLGLFVVFAVNVVAANFFWRFDLTEEKRYTLQDPTKELLRKLNQPLHVEVLLGTDLPTEFQRFQKSIVETIEELGVYSNQPIYYSINDPGAASTETERNKNYQAWMDSGLSPTRIFDNDNGTDVQKLIFPYVVLRYGDRTSSVLLLKGNQGASFEAKLNQSLEGIEYELATGIQRIADIDRKRIGLLQGHGELDSLNIYWFARDFSEAFDIVPVNLSETEELKNFDVIIMAKPTKAFSREDKFKIDQHLMHGGKAIFMVDALGVDMRQAGGVGTFGLPYTLDLDDLFFRYGIRLKKDFVLDVQNFGRYPVLMDDSQTITNLRWPFFFGASWFSEHPITRNLDAIYTRFTSTLDTVAAQGIKKTPLMFTSQYTRILNAPAPVSFEEIAAENEPSLYQGGQHPIAYLLEGEFESLFKNRVLPKEGVNTIDFKSDSPDTKILIVGDGDIIRNEMQRGVPLDLGFNPYAEGQEKTVFANKDFMMNALMYLMDDDGLIQARNKEIKLRPLDRIRAQNEKLKWQLINLVGPIVLLVLFGLIRNFIRVRKYSRF
ncbi:gliding motility-associated ABC transporter substrate-binding protein GldG [Roseivirga sp.]|uniref:gliding motility-associated ABC transporter substrate-binding protein GldG n=1 Tax=Roseivirga sp. TaxID=1964215 RepID=UPI002B26A2E9|nr:gliding motility-associated ABC transporter substrate-binding protein GldG [Roseivirga sp.]